MGSNPIPSSKLQKKIIIIRRVGEVVNTLVLLNKIDYLVYAALM